MTYNILIVYLLHLFMIEKEKKIYTKTLDIKTIQKLIDIASYKDDMVHLLTREFIIQKDNLDKMNAYHMSVYQDMYKK